MCGMVVLKRDSSCYMKNDRYYLQHDSGTKNYRNPMVPVDSSASLVKLSSITV